MSNLFLDNLKEHAAVFEALPALSPLVSEASTLMAEAVKAGGKVMKNVTGLDLVKLLAGSHGTLGFLTEVTFKVLPVPKTAVTIVLSGLEDEQAMKALADHGAVSVIEQVGHACRHRRYVRRS